jgi:hypothetical protein
MVKNQMLGCGGMQNGGLVSMIEMMCMAMSSEGKVGATL